MTRSIVRGLALAICSSVVLACGDDASDDTSGASTTAATEPTGSQTDTEAADTETGEASTSETETDDQDFDAPDIVGNYVENFPGGQATHRITETSWIIDFDGVPAGYDFVDVDNAAMYIVGEDMGMPGVFAKLQWTFVADDLYYCTVVFAASSAEDAAAAPPADDSDPSTGGCADFPWSLLEPA
jgi:hypothetical protein